MTNDGIETEAWRRYPQVDTTGMLYDEVAAREGRRDGFIEGARAERERAAKILEANAILPPGVALYHEAADEWQRYAEALQRLAARIREDDPISEPPRRRLRICVERWPACATSEYDPACCRFPKSCSADIYDDDRVSDDDLEAT